MTEIILPLRITEYLNKSCTLFSLYACWARDCAFSELAQVIVKVVPKGISRIVFIVNSCIFICFLLKVTLPLIKVLADFLPH